VRIRTIGPIVAALIAVMAHPAQAQQGEFVKSKLKALIEKSGVYVSTTTRSSLDNDVHMGQTFGIGYGTAGSKRNGWKFPFSFSGYRGDLETAAGTAFGEFKASQLMSGVGYQWVHGKMVYSAQLGVGYSFNKIMLDAAAPAMFSSTEPLGVSVSNSFVLRPQIKAEYFIHPKVSLRTQLSYTYTDPDVIVNTGTETFGRQWRPHHTQLSAAVGFFPFRK
jgi:hypothetical protein